MDQKKKTGLRERLKYKYRISIINEDSFDEVGWVRLSLINVLLFVLIIVILVGGGTASMFFFTSIKEYIPGYPDAKVQQVIVRNTIAVDSLTHELKLQEQYIAGIKTILGGDLPPSFYNDSDSSESSSTHFLERISFTPSKEDSIFRAQIEEDEKYNLQVFSDTDKDDRDEELLLFAPIKGVIVQQFNKDEGHFGVDLVAGINEKVMAVEDGTVIFSEWTVETGHVIQIQHENNLISVYKHNSRVLKKVGEIVSGGEAIAIVGNSGELTTGPHLHIELWRDGMALDPVKHIVF